MGKEELSRKWSYNVSRIALLAHIILIDYCAAKDQAQHEEMPVFDHTSPPHALRESEL